MRYPAACMSPDLLGLLPFSAQGQPGASATYQPLADPVAWDRFYEWWFRVKSWLLEITIAFDPATVAPGGANPGTYTLLLARQLTGHEIEQERALLRPGAQDDVLAPTDGHGRFTGVLSIGSPDDYFNTIDWTAEMNICPLAAPGGYQAIGDAGLPAVRYATDPLALTFTPTITLVVSATYDDGTEGIFSIQLHDPALSPSPPADVLATGGTMDGFALDAYAIGFSPSYADLGVAPVITLTPFEWYEFRRSNETEPIYDSTDGTVIDGQTPFTNVL